MSGEGLPANAPANAPAIAPVNAPVNAPAIASAPGLDSSAAAICPRCGARFHCGASIRAPCACSTVKLNAAQLAGLRQRYSNCLCLACLASLPALS